MPEKRTPSHDPRLAQFAAELQRLHRQAGRPTYRELQRVTGYGRTVLSEALNGNRLPTWPVTQALVQALGGDPEEWRPRWAATDHAFAHDDQEPQANEANHGSVTAPGEVCPSPLQDPASTHADASPATLAPARSRCRGRCRPARRGAGRRGPPLSRAATRRCRRRARNRRRRRPLY
jgi:hypothetical protein